MIKINLLGEKKDNRAIYILQLGAAVIVLLLTIVGCFVVNSIAASQISDMQTEKQDLETKLAKLQKQTEKVADLENKKKTLREKLATIAVLKSRKRGPVHILDDLNGAIPDKAWLLSIKDKSGNLELTGVALDNQVVSTFMYNLEQSKYFGSVELIQSIETEVSGVKMKQFSLLVPVKDPILEQQKKQAAAAAAAANKGPKPPPRPKSEKEGAEDA